MMPISQSSRFEILPISLLAAISICSMVRETLSERVFVPTRIASERFFITRSSCTSDNVTSCVQYERVALGTFANFWISEYEYPPLRRLLAKFFFELLGY